MYNSSRAPKNEEQLVKGENNVIYYPHDDDMSSFNSDKLGVLIEAAERFKAVVLETAAKVPETANDPKKRNTPKESLHHVFNWDGIAKVLRELRELPENNQASRLSKANQLQKLAEVYEILRGAKMPKLEAVRLALVNESDQLRTGG